MRVRLFLLIFSAVLFMGAAAAPGLVRAAVPQADFIRASVRGYSRQVTCSGIVGQPVSRQVFASTPVIADRVLVSPGDIVAEGDTLVVVDTELTKSVLSRSLTVETGGGAAPFALAAADPEMIKQAAALYGVSPEELLPLARQPQQIRSVEAAGETLAVPQSILAPISGVVTQVGIQSGVLAQSADPAFTIADNTRFTVSAPVGEGQIGAVAVGDAARVAVGAAGRDYMGVVSAIAPAAQRAPVAGQQATVEVTVDILDPDGLLKGNYTATAEIISQDSRSLLTLPYEAIGQDADNTEYVWVYADGRAHKKSVVTGEELADCVEVISGADGDDIILLGALLEDGHPVRLGKEGLG